MVNIREIRIHSKNFRIVGNQPQKVSERSETQIRFRDGPGNPLEVFKEKKWVSAPSETLNRFLIVTKSETERGF